MRDLREPALQGPDLAHCPQIAVVAHGIAAVCQRIGKYVQMDRPPVFFLPHTGVDGETGDGIAVVEVQQSGKFLRRLIAQPGLDGYRQ